MLMYSLLGCMRSGKTTSLNEIAKTHSSSKIDLDMKEEDIDDVLEKIGTAIKRRYQSKKILNLMLCKTPVVLIDEFQFIQYKKGYQLLKVYYFFEDIKMFYENNDINIVIASLHKDYKGEVFEVSNWLCDYLKDNVYAQYGYCEKCGEKNATLNPRKKGQGNSLFIEDKDIYSTLCVDCFEKHRDNFEAHK